MSVCVCLSFARRRTFSKPKADSSRPFSLSFLFPIFFVATLSYRELFALDQGALPFDTPIKEIQERHQELLRNPDATALKIVNLQYTLPVIFRQVPTVPEAHCRQIYILPSMNVRQVLDIVTREMGLKSLDATAENNTASSSATRIPTSADFVFSQVKVNAEGVEGERTRLMN